jgi:hypothetical protein
MDLQKALNAAHSRSSVNCIIGWVGKSPARFNQLVSYLLKGPPGIPPRAAWPVSYCVQAYPGLAQPYLKSFAHILGKKELDGAVKRSIVRMLQFVNIHKNLQGSVADHCFTFLSDPKEAPAVRVFSMRVLENHTALNPDLRNELALILEEQLPYASAGFVCRARKIIASNQRHQTKG